MKRIKEGLKSVGKRIRHTSRPSSSERPQTPVGSDTGGDLTPPAVQLANFPQSDTAPVNEEGRAAEDSGPSIIVSDPEGRTTSAAAQSAPLSTSDSTPVNEARRATGDSGQSVIGSDAGGIAASVAPAVAQPATPTPSGSTPVNEQGKAADEREPSVIAGLAIGALTLAKEVVEEIPFPGVKSAVSGLVALIEMCQAPGENEEAVNELTTRAKELLDMLPSEYMEGRSGDGSSWGSMIDQIKSMTEEVDKIIKRGERIASHGYLHRFATQKADKGLIEDLVKRVNDIIERFKLFLKVKRTVVTEEMMETKRWKFINEIPRANARYNDATRKDKFEGCFEGTNEDVLKTIDGWIAKPDAPKIFWLCGAAGMGKTTIAQTVAEQQKEQGRLGASFFFSATGEANVRTTALFFPTIAHQLAQIDRKILDAIYASLRKDLDVVHNVMPSQIKPLLVQPLAKWGGSGVGKPLVLVVDALDECSSEADVKTLLGLLASNIEAFPSGFRLLLTSRPEWRIETEFASNSLTTAHVPFLLHDLRDSIIGKDILLYLEDRLRGIAERHRLGAWPTKHELESLRKKCGLLFIAASTVVKFLDSPDWSPKERLELYLGNTAASAAQEAYEPLDALYAQIVSNSVPNGIPQTTADRIRTRFRAVVGGLVLLKEDFTVQQLDVFLRLNSGTVDIALRRLKAVILVPDTTNQPLRFFHFSFPEFLVDSKRCTDKKFWLNESQEHGSLALLCLNHMKDTFPSDPLQQEEWSRWPTIVADIQARLEPHVFSALRYSCIHFASHFALSSDAADPNTVLQIEDFCKNKLLAWLAFLSYVRELNVAVSSVGTILTIYSETTRPDDQFRALLLQNLANSVLTRYGQQGNERDIAEAIGGYREALNLCPLGHPSLSVSLNGLSNALLARYSKEGSLSDLEEAIEKHHKALSLCPQGHPGRPTSLSYLANALLSRWEREGSLSDLEEAVEMHREVFNLCPPGHPHHASSLNNLANALLTRYGREGSLADLVEATEQVREALELRPPGHPDRALSLNNLANALLTRYGLEGSLADLVEATERVREALELRPPGHPDRALSLNNLANALLTRYEREGSLADLSEATELYREALELRPPSHPDRSNSLLSLSRTLIRTHLLLIDNASTVHDHSLLVNEVFLLLREAVDHPESPPLDRLQAALYWINTSASLAPESVLDAYNAALDQLDIVLATGSTLADKHALLFHKGLVLEERRGPLVDNLLLEVQVIAMTGRSAIEAIHAESQYKRLGVEAALCAVRQGNVVLAVEFLERGRNLLFAQIGRYRVELKGLQNENAELAKRFSDLSGLLDSHLVSNQPTIEGRTAFEDHTARYRRVVSDWDRAVDDIRCMPGYENFLRPPQYTALRAAAAEGPVIIVIPDDDESHALIILPYCAKPHHVCLPEASKNALVELCESFIQAVHCDSEGTANHRMRTLLRNLWILVVHPIADALENELHCPLGSRIWWCPSSFLSLLPLHAAGRYASNVHPDQNLPATYVSSYTPSLHALLQARSNHNISEGENMLIVTQPDTPGGKLLPNVMEEAIIVKKLAEVKMKMGATLLSSKDGTYAAVLDSMANHSWIHLACIGGQNRADPFDSCFCLYDKPLTLRNIMQQRLPDASFAFLSTSDTATGDTKLLDEGLHLASGLLFTGFKSIVATMGPIADIDGPVIAEAFYQALRPEQVGEGGIDCRGAALALNKAVRSLRDNGVPINRWIRYVHIGI